MTANANTRTPEALRKRLAPLHVAIGLQGMLLWLPVEKLFMKQIGFTAASIGVLAAAYAAVTPVLEIPSGILADRWSRRGVLIISAVSLLSCSLIGGLSHSVSMYIVSALILGVYFAMYSGTVESIVYDVVLEETGVSELFQARLGRVRVVESVALVTSSLAGGWLAGLTSPRVTYFLSVPFAAAAVIAYLRFDEPHLHRTSERVPLRQHVAVTYQTIARRGAILPIIVLGALTSLILQSVFEFGPLWLVAMAAPAVLFGPYWAGLVSTLGVGGVLVSRLRLNQPAAVGVVVAVMVVSSVVLNVSESLAAVIGAQVAIALLLAVASIHVTNLLHDAVPSTIRAGVASGVSTVSWIGFLPFALVFGWLAREHGVHTAGWMMTAAIVVVGVLLIRMTARPHPQVVDSRFSEQDLLPATELVPAVEVATSCA